MMDANDIAVGLTSMAQPGVDFLGPAQAKMLARRLNEHACELMAKWPKRFGALATVPMSDVGAAVAEVEFALDTLKHHGVSLFASYDEKFLGDAAFDPVMDALNARKAVVFVHPTLHPSSQALSLSFPGYIAEFLFDTTRAALNMIFSGTIDRYPYIRFILPHAGGTLPYFAWRFGSTSMLDPKMPQWTRAQYAEKLRHFWYDIAMASGPTAMGALKTVADPGKIVFASDWPFVHGQVLADTIRQHETPDLHSAAERAAIDRDNALKLFPMFA